jgi:hypothetical protein
MLIDILSIELTLVVGKCYHRLTANAQHNTLLLDYVTYVSHKQTFQQQGIQ